MCSRSDETNVSCVRDGSMLKNPWQRRSVLQTTVKTEAFLEMEAARFVADGFPQEKRFELSMGKL